MLKPFGGRGLLLPGVPGVPGAKIAILGAGVAGMHAAEIAVGLRADVTMFEISAERLAAVDSSFSGTVKGVHSSRKALLDFLPQADAVIGCVLVAGAAAPKLIRREDMPLLKPGAVLVDVAIDQGGCFETSHPTTHDHPTFVVDGIVHYCVANMPGAVARTSTYALNNVTLPRALRIADLGWQEAMRQDPHLAAGLNVHAGRVTYPAVAEELGYELLPVEEVLAS
jgi:alanine dehydrogenase